MFSGCYDEDRRRNAVAGTSAEGVSARVDSLSTSESGLIRANPQQRLPNNLGMGIAYWDPAGGSIPRLTGGWFNGGNGLPDAIYIWNGLTLFGNADNSGNTDVNDPSYATPLPGLDALSGH